MALKYNNKNLSKNLFVLAIMTYPMILFIVFWLGININSIILAFQKISLDGSKTFIGFENFNSFITELLSDGSLLGISAINSLKMYIINLVFCMPLYIIFSYLLFKKCFLHKTIRFIIMVPKIVSVFIICLLFKKFISIALPDIALEFFNIDDFPNLLKDPHYTFNTTIFYMIWISFSTSLIVYPNAMNEIPQEIIESAKIDGVDNMFTELKYIILPLIYPTLSTFLIIGFSSIMSNSGPLVEFYMYEAYPEVYNVGYYYLVKVIMSSESAYPVLAAGGLIMTIIIAPLTYGLKVLLEKKGPSSDM